MFWQFSSHHRKDGGQQNELETQHLTSLIHLKIGNVFVNTLEWIWVQYCSFVLLLALIRSPLLPLRENISHSLAVECSDTASHLRQYVCLLCGAEAPLRLFWLKKKKKNLCLELILIMVVTIFFHRHVHTLFFLIDFLIDTNYKVQHIHPYIWKHNVLKPLSSGPMT